MIVDIGARTDVGQVRLNNEDNFYIAEALGLLVVADGMGGHASGEVASKMAIDIIRDYFDASGGEKKPLIGDSHEEYSEETNRLASAIRLANMAIHEAAKNNSQYQGMGTTVAAVLLNDRRLSIAHVGDSRVYLARAGDMEQLTDDHSLVYEQVKREMITREEASVSEMKNVLTRAVGTRPEVEVDLSEMTLFPGDILILCSDGLHGMVPDEEILDTVSFITDPEEACEKLIQKANESGGRDNITVAVAYIRQKKAWFPFLSKIMEWFRR